MDIYLLFTAELDMKPKIFLLSLSITDPRSRTHVKKLSLNLCAMETKQKDFKLHCASESAVKQCSTFT